MSKTENVIQLPDGISKFVLDKLNGDKAHEPFTTLQLYNEIQEVFYDQDFEISTLAKWLVQNGFEVDGNGYWK